MNASIKANSFNGKISAIASKSVAHRLLICAAFADKPTKIKCETLNNDILSTVSCLSALGASITYSENQFCVEPIKEVNENAVLDCKESGSTLRFLLPVACAVSSKTTFLMSGRLPERPLSPLKEELEAHGVTFNYDNYNELSVNGKISSGDYKISGKVSSQFISGLLFALSLLDGKSTLSVTDSIESAPYIELTLNALSQFGSDITRNDQTFFVSGQKLTSPDTLKVEGDWSNVAFALCGAALSGDVTTFNLNTNSFQGDKEIITLLRRFGAKIEVSENAIRVASSKLSAIEIDATDIPDLVPILATVASVAQGTTRIFGASRLRIKESDRLISTSEMLKSLGADVEEYDDGLVIHGKDRLTGGIVSSFNDHRIAMSAAIASVICDTDVTVINAEAVDKSYPGFWKDIASLGATVNLNNQKGVF